MRLSSSNQCWISLAPASGIIIINNVSSVRERESGARAAALYLRCLVSSPNTLGVPLSWYPLPRPLWASFLSWSGNKQLILIFLLAKLMSVFHFQSQPTEFSIFINSYFLVKRVFFYLVFSMSEQCTQENIWESSATKVKCVISQFGIA